jgi:predicted nucleotide-binding protein (sugar kinase/HSP70/actin superfamily)
MAAILRCDIKEVKKHFNSPEECVEANTVRPVVSTKVKEPEVIIVEPPIELQETHVEQQMALESMEQRMARIEREQRATQKLIHERRQLAQKTLEKLENDPED